MRSPNSSLKVALVGSGGRLGKALARSYSQTHQVFAFNRAELDLADEDALRSQLAPLDFDLLVNAAAQTNVDRCEAEPDEAFALNAEAPSVLAEICAEKNARMIHVSTDYVFDGAQRHPYTEENEAEPISVYGESKLAGEQCVLDADPRHMVVRVSWVFGPDRPSFVDWVIGQARTHEKVEAVADKISTPTYTLDLAEMIAALFAPEVPGGLIHLANAGACSWQEYGQWALDCCRSEGLPLKATQVDATTLAAMKNFVARRPPYTVLATAKYQALTGKTPRPWQEAVAAYVRDHVAPRAQD